METDEKRSYWQLADLAGAGACPDSGTSEGALFLLGIADDVQEAVESDPELVQSEDWQSEKASEIADQAVPIYTFEKWAAFVDLAAWQEDLDDLGGTSGDMDKDSNMALFMIGERLALALLAEAADAQADDED